MIESKALVINCNTILQLFSVLRAYMRYNRAYDRTGMFIMTITFFKGHNKFGNIKESFMNQKAAVLHIQVV